MLSASSVSISFSLPARSKTHQHFVDAPLQRLDPCCQITHVCITPLKLFDFPRHSKSRGQRWRLKPRLFDVPPRNPPARVRTKGRQNLVRVGGLCGPQAIKARIYSPASSDSPTPVF